AHRLAIELRRVRRDLVRRELADELADLAVELDGLLHRLRAVGGAEAVLGELDERAPVDAAVEVVLEVVVVLEEVAHLEGSLASARPLRSPSRRHLREPRVREQARAR